jgi:hypothetical protein
MLYQVSIRKSKLMFFFLAIPIILGCLLFVFNILFYPSMRPKIITGTTSNWLDLSVYLFYTLYIVRMVMIAIGILRIMRKLAHNNHNSFDKKFLAFNRNSSFYPSPSKCGE